LVDFAPAKLLTKLCLCKYQISTGYSQGPTNPPSLVILCTVYSFLEKFVNSLYLRHSDGSLLCPHRWTLFHRQMHAVHTLILCYFTLFNIPTPIIPKSSDYLFPSGFMTEFLYYILTFSTSATHLQHRTILNLIMHTILHESFLSCVVHVPPLGQMTKLHTQIKQVKL
jgi:hypothetical protein